MVTDDPAIFLSGHGADRARRAVIGCVTSAAYGATVGQSIAYGYLPPAHADPGTRIGIRCDGAVHEAVVVAEPLYDPAMDRLRDVAPATPA